jgi:hypothetical protein
MVNDITFLNCAILTTEGEYKFTKAKIENIRSMVNRLHDSQIHSAIGHESTAQILSKILGIDIPVNRVNFQQSTLDFCIVFKLRERAPEGKILSVEEIEKIGYDFYYLYKIADPQKRR